MSSIYVDEAAGSDTTGTGSQEAPYQTLGYALYTHATASFLIRKDATAEYAEPTQSSLKKAKKTADGIEKKKKKQEELDAREAQANREEKEKREKLLEESKKIVLTEDESLPKANKVRELLRTYVQRFTLVPVQDPGPWPIQDPTRSRIRMGPSAKAAEGHYLYRVARWDWLPSGSSLRSRRADLQRTYFDSRVLCRARRNPPASA